jgi:hypothetical protein
MLTKNLQTADGSIRLLNHPTPEVIASMAVEDGLGSPFHFQPDVLKGMLERSAALEGAEVVVAGTPQRRLVGYLVMLPPDPIERWGRDPALPLYEVGGMEVARAFRRIGLARGMLGLPLSEESWEERIILAPLYAEQWDLDGSGLDRPAYRNMLLHLAQPFGFAEFPTDEPEITADPANRLLVRVGRQIGPGVYARFRTLLDDRKTPSIRQINLLPKEEREGIYGRLIPNALFKIFDIDRQTLTDRFGRRLVTFLCPPDQDLVRIEVRLTPDDRDYLYLLKLDQTFDGELELGFIIINDPRGERFQIDRDENGQQTHLGTTGRNLKDEERAMKAGLAPGQVRWSLRLLGRVLRLVEEFTAFLGRDRFVLEAKFYHMAILCERYGFGYVIGEQEMASIHQGFTPGGPLFRRLDGSTPFRQPGIDQTVRGRSWAIHDGILGEPWKAPRMYKLVGKRLQVCTFPGAVY